MVTILLALVVCLVGATIFLITDKKVSQLALYAFAVGLLVTLLSVSGQVDVSVHPTPAHVR